MIDFIIIEYGTDLYKEEYPHVKLQKFGTLLNKCTLDEWWQKYIDCYDSDMNEKLLSCYRLTMMSVDTEDGISVIVTKHSNTIVKQPPRMIN